LHATLFDIDGAAQFFEHARGSGDAEWDQRACASLGWNFVAVGPELGGIETYTGVHL
jgi:hypothetical protein